MYKNRYHFWSDYKNYLININNNFSSYDYFEKYYFNSQQGIEKFFNLIRDVFNYDGELKDLYKSFICDINWAKSSQFCQVKVTNVDNTTNQQPTSGDFPDCVKNLKLAKLANRTQYYYGKAFDERNNYYDVEYFNIQEQTGVQNNLFYCKIIPSETVQRPIEALYRCPILDEKYIIITNFESVSDTLGRPLKLSGFTNQQVMKENLNRLIKNTLIETKETKKKQLIESKIINTRFKIIVETDKLKSQDDLDDVLIDILYEMVYLHNQGFDDKLIAESVEGVFGVLSNLFKGGSSSILDTFKEKGVAYIIKHLGFDGNTYLENFLITAIGNTSLSDVPKLFTDCNFLTKRIAETIPEAYLRKLEYDKGMGSVFMDAIRNSLYDVIRNSDFAERIESSISGIVCPLVDKMSGSFAKKLGNMKTNLIGNTQV
jgi:hypothetical protein